jgi:DNA-binding response OmpR family regulator/tetratricopeptide (TPR) repeat protein
MPPYLLVVESDPDLQQRIGSTLREAHYELAAETDAAWAKRSLLVRPPDGVILDTHLSDGSGFSVAEALRQDPDTEHVPIFFVASRFRGASHQAETRRRFAPAEYLTTPLDLDSLLAMVLETVPPSDPGRPGAVADYPPSSPAMRAFTDNAQRRERRSVEAAARELVDPELRGSLAFQPFARILQRIYTDRLTGALLLMRDAIKKIVYFAEGYPVSVRSNLLGECLGQILLSQKLITRHVLDESLRRMKAQRKHQGTVLVEMGALSPYNLERALVAQMEAKFFEIFSWQAGDFAFKQGKNAPDEPVRLERAPAALTLEGVRRHYDQERIRAVLAPFSGQFVAPSRDPHRRMQDITPDPGERRFVESLDGSLRLEAALANAPIPIQKARLLLVAMSESGMIEAARASRRGDARADLAEDAQTPGPERPSDNKGREELVATLEAMRGQTHFEVLGVPAEASPGEVDSAYEGLAREYHPDHFRFRPEDVRALGLKIFDRLGESQATLRDPGRRRKYQAQIDRERAAREEHEEDGAVFVQRSSPGGAAEQVYFAGVEHLRARRYRDAVQAFRQACHLAPQEAGYRGALGWAIFRQAPADIDAIQAGLAELRRAVQMDPNDPWVRISLGRFFAETGYPDDAISEFEVALRLNPGLPDIEEEIRRLRGQT